MNRRIPLAILAVLCSLAAAGCGWNKISQTQINVKYAGDEFVHVAMVPTTLANGKPATEARAELLEKLGEQVDSWTLTPGMKGAMRMKKDGALVQVEGELLMVEGPQEVGLLVWESLKDDFDIARPWLVSLPTQSVLMIPAPPAPDAEDATEAE